ncbi:MAG TPA: NAD(P)H-dependent oxidoreductase [Patescibacteria group bacterium]|nr:NAD(P)H-dependent oxidoreductase [Patescibacteria group bacterium]
MRVTLVNGSASSDSHTGALLSHIQLVFAKKGVDVQLIHLLDLDLPTVMPEYHQDPIKTPNARVKTWIRLIENSDALILATPLYHGSYSGLLKNALDQLAPDALRGKIVGLVTNAGGGRSIQALEHLQTIIRTLYGYTAQTFIATNGEDYERTTDGYVLQDEGIQRRSERLVDEILFLTQSLTQQSLQG